MFRTTAITIGFLLMAGTVGASELTHTEDILPSLSQALAASQKAPTTQGRRLYMPDPHQKTVKAEAQPAAAPEVDKPCPKNPWKGYSPSGKTSTPKTSSGG